MAKEAVNIKGTRQGLVILFDADRDFEDIKAGLKYKMESSRGFFAGARFALHGGKNLVPAEISELEAICREYGLVPDPGVQWPPSRAGQPRKTNFTFKNRAALPGEPALLVNRTLRSGQVVTHHGHITILGDIHQGAEVVAGGNILVMGNCSGFIQSGAGGDVNSCILAMSIYDAHLRIADYTLIVPGRRPPGGPVIAHIKENMIKIEPYKI